MAQQSESHSLDLFINENAAKEHECPLCLCIMEEATSIGCNEDHFFCRQCIDKQFAAGDFNCSICRDGPLSVQTLHPSKAMDRLISKLQVRCKLENARKPIEGENELSDKDEVENEEGCNWIGTLGDLSNHLNGSCPLFPVVCDDCGLSMKRVELRDHREICPEKVIQCDLCNVTLPRKQMDIHTESECGKFEIDCNYCHVKIVRERMKEHIDRECPEVIVDCEFEVYGCKERMKRKDHDAHLKEPKAKQKHTELKLEYTELKLAKSERRIEILEQKLQPFTVSNNLLVIRNQGAPRTILKCNIRDGKTEQIFAIPQSDAPKCYNYVFGKIPLHVGIRMGFKSELKIGNDILFGFNRKRICAYFIDSGKVECFNGNMNADILAPVVSIHHSGLLMVGGTSAEDKMKSVNTILKIKFNDGVNHTFSAQKVKEMSYAASGVSALILNGIEERLFVCGGSSNGEMVRNAEIHNVESGDCTKLKDMNHDHIFAGICRLDHGGDKIVVAGGIDGTPNGSQFVEEYDFEKNKWTDLPKLNGKHNSYPALWSSNGILICAGGQLDMPFQQRLGIIETLVLDQRDRQQQWMKADSVQKYFGLSHDRVFGHGTILPM